MFGVGLVRLRGEGRSLSVCDLGGQLSYLLPELPWQWEVDAVTMLVPRRSYLRDALVGL